MNSRLHLRLPALVRGYATRLPQKPPMRHPDPLLKDPSAVTTSLPDDLTFIHRPPPSAPTPLSFTTNPVSPLLRPAPAALDGAPLPPPLAKPKPGYKRVPDEAIAEMRRLRTENPKLWTRSKLAEKFGCSHSFISYAAPLSRDARRIALARRDTVHEKARARWGEVTATIRDIRKKRKEFW
ncbi:mitochondrial ribosomal protein subunit L20-domain-containing protein [Gloeopeniophorella convolvens]|nr:mitochondrial ribosomal protein subunit L20-domain-containing protein [Gloeopeniophorella convolvens]